MQSYLRAGKKSSNTWLFLNHIRCSLIVGANMNISVFKYQI